MTPVVRLAAAVTWPVRWWRGLSQVDRFDRYTRWSLYALLVLSPLMILGTSSGSQPARPVAAAAVAGASLVQAALGAAAVGVVLARRRSGGPAPVRLLVALAVVTLVGLVLSSSQLADEVYGGTIANAFFVVTFVGLLSLVVRVRAAAAALLAIIAVPVVVQVLAGSVTGRQATAVPVFASVTLIAGVSAIMGYRASLWMLDVVWELDRARDVQARLAVAEERLRFGRDLHDVVGRGLAVVSLKSDLAAQLAKRGRPEAADEMLEVRRVAQDLLAEVRDVVRGYRTTDLDAELAGARSVLGSAGIECRIIGSSQAIAEQAQTALGWVVREGTTNVLRHSQARACTIALRVEEAADRIELTMESDGATGDEPLVLGHGLLGLAERVAAVGGVLRAQRLPGARFRLTAEVPK
jgi:two-component system sensor histidine kinase DesK